MANNEDIDFGGITEALNDKLDRDGRNVDTTSGADIVVEWQAPTAENNYTWYRLYKSGWVEQGGYYLGSTDGWVEQALMIPMSNTFYSVTIERSRKTDTGDPGTGGIDRRCFFTNGYTTTSFKMWGIWATYPCSWEVKGFAAQS